MHDYRRVLAMVSLSRDGEKVAWRALRLARLLGAEAAWLHLVVADGQLDGGYPTPSRAGLAQGYEDAALLRLRHLAASMHAGEVALRARHGPAADCYREFIDDWRPDLVIAAHDPGYLAGRHDLLLLGSEGLGMGRLVRAWLKRWRLFLADGADARPA
jgi:nucleotide-binding universal stress UspA family protein